MTFEWPWIFALLPLPWLVRWLWKPASAEHEAALRVPDLGRFELGEAAGMLRAGSGGRAWWLALPAWVLLVTATARPMWVGAPVELPVGGRDVMLAVDLSGSMRTEDFVLAGRKVDRLTAIQAIAGEFVRRRVGDRLGLILFGSKAYLQAPLTFDRQTVGQLLAEAAIGLAGEQTAIGDAIGLATRELRRHLEGNRVVILLTDGANVAGALEPEAAARIAAKEGVTIYTIGVGAGPMQVPGFFGMRQVNPSQDLDEDALRLIASITHGRYFRAMDAKQLAEIYAVIDQLQPIDKQQQTFRPRRSLFHWPLALALFWAAGLLGWKARSA